MDITQCKKSRFTNSFMNGETVNYIISIILSFFVLIASKQVLKLFGMSAQIACWAAFAIGEIALFLLEKLFVYRDNALNDNAKQIIYSVINTALHLGIFGALSSPPLGLLALHPVQRKDVPVIDYTSQFARLQVVQKNFL